MHSHHIALALADARVADLQRAAPHTPATAPARRHRRTLALLGLVTTAALAALAPTGAFARPIEAATPPPSSHFEGGPADQARQDLRSPRPDSPRSGASIGDLPPNLRSLAMEERAANAAARPAPAVQRHASTATPRTVSDGSGWGIGALVGGGFAAMVALVSLTVVFSRRNRQPAAG
jgi:hypothetical protein